MAYLDAFPSLAIIAQEETKKDMDLIQPGNIERGPEEMAQTIAVLKQGKTPGGRTLTEDEKKQVQDMLPKLEQQDHALRADLPGGLGAEFMKLTKEGKGNYFAVLGEKPRK